MPRLFVAIDLPEWVTASLAAIQPPKVPGLRLVDRSLMHLTLHFLGDSNVERTSSLLRDVVAPVVPLSIEKVGLFRGRTTIAWAGVRMSAELAELHARLASALRRAGFEPEVRPYHPHITLARCEPRVPESLLLQFLESHAEFSLPAILATSVHLFSSDVTGAAPVYRNEASFELASSG